MFLTIGEKVKKSRKKYKIKQVAFEPYGITQYYLSLIENGKRNSSEEIIACIFDAFVELTNNKILEDYTKEEFVKTKQIQLKEYISEKLNQDLSIDEIKHLISLAKSYDEPVLLYELHIKLGEIYRLDNEFKLSNTCLIEAIDYAKLATIDLNEVYVLIGLNLIDMENYEGALGYFITAYNNAKPETADYYELKHRVAALESTIGNHHKAIEYVDDVILNCPFKAILVKAVIAKERYLRLLGHHEEAIDSLLERVSCPDFSHLLFFIYQNLARNYKALGDYKKAIYYAKESIEQPWHAVFAKEHIQVLLAEIYFDDKQYDKALIILDEIKQVVKNDQDYTLASMIYSLYLKIHIIQNNQAEIMQLLTELKELRDADRIKTDFYYKQKTKALQYILEVNNIVNV